MTKTKISGSILTLPLKILCRTKLSLAIGACIRVQLFNARDVIELFMATIVRISTCFQQTRLKQFLFAYSAVTKKTFAFLSKILKNPSINIEPRSSMA